MALIEIIHFIEKSLPDSDVPRTTVDDKIQNATKALKGVKNPQHFALGTQVQDKATIQIISEWDSDQDHKTLEATSEYSSLINSVRDFCGKPDSIFHVPLNRSAFGPDGAATAPVVEFVQNYFPASRVTTEFQKQVEEDFLRFDGMYRKGAKGNFNWASGWVIEEQEHESIKGEKAKCFFIARGWESMNFFEQSVQNDAYKEAIPILFAWNAPWKMWHVENKVLNGIEVVA
ncbi:hypothetical protein VE03_07267 [Pseudogymnoascus sp. 23342-1-I1]|nr:hypothetical protein VE03_07267 [Pseudogymnoascus sp. 23342-1-I1]